MQHGCSTCFQNKMIFVVVLSFTEPLSFISMRASWRAETFQEPPAVSGPVTQGGTGAALFCSRFLEPVPPPVPCGLSRDWQSAWRGRTLCPSACLAFQFSLLERVPCFPSLPRLGSVLSTGGCAGGQKETAVAVTAVGEGGRAGDGAARCLPSHEALLPWKASI